MTAVLDTATVTELAAAVAGPVLEPGDDSYAAEVASFSTTHAAIPAVVVGATCADDVAAAVRWAARAGRRARQPGSFGSGTVRSARACSPSATGSTRRACSVPRSYPTEHANRPKRSPVGPRRC
jgi:hypothetical protein